MFPPLSNTTTVTVQFHLAQWEPGLYFHVSFYDESAEDRSANKWPNQTYGADFAIAQSSSTASLFLAMWTIQKVPIGPLNISQSLGEIKILGADTNTVIEFPHVLPNGWAFAELILPKIDVHVPSLGYFQVISTCSNAVHAAPLDAYLGACTPPFCTYPQYMQPMEFKALSINSTQSYQIGYFNGEGAHVVIAVHNNRSLGELSSCHLSISVYQEPIVVFNLSNTVTEMTSQPITIVPLHYQLFQITTQSNNQTLSVTVQNADGFTDPLFTMYYTSGPLLLYQDMIRATTVHAQTLHHLTLEASILGFPPYQPFALYNHGGLAGKVVITVSNAVEKDGMRPWMWALVGVGSVMLLSAVGMVGYYYVFKKRGYVDIQETRRLK